MTRFLFSGILAVLTVFYQASAAQPDFETDIWPIDPLAYDGQQTADGTVLNLADGTVVIINGAPSGPNYAALYATNGGEISLRDGFLSLNNVESVGAATADTNGSISLEGVRIETYASSGGRWQTGLMASTGGSIDFSSGSIVTWGEFSHGIHAFSDGTLTVANSSITTHGGSASGAYVGINSTVNITDSDILTTSSDEGYGLYAIYQGAVITMTNGSLTTEGSAASASLPLPAVYGRRGASITLNSVTLEAKGTANASGLLARETGTVVTMNGGSITTAGADSYGAYAI